jgi:ATP-dependent Lon protease
MADENNQNKGGSGAFIADPTNEEIRIPNELPLLTVRNTVLYPDLILPLVVAREKSVQLVDSVLAQDRLLGVVAQRDPEVEDPQPEDLYDYGAAGTIIKVLKFPDGSIRVLIRGLARIRVETMTNEQPFFRAQVRVLKDRLVPSKSLDEKFAKVRDLVKESPVISRETTLTALSIEPPGMFADYVATNLNLKVNEMQEVVETLDPSKRLDIIQRHLKKESEVHAVKASIQDEVRSQIDKSQREYYLRQQLKAIRRELGEDDDSQNEIEEFRERLAKAGLPPDAMKEADRELKRMEKMHPEGAEFTVARTYIDWLCELPWTATSEDNLDITHAQHVLDDDHYAMEKAKQRIVEYLAVRKLKNDMKGPILCLVGPPGVGKTSLARSVARSMGRKFERIALGGVRDEAEIRGHRRTYVGALPGRVIRSLRRAGTRNPVMLLDEIDKLGSDFRGDPSSAMLEVLDPEQNVSFTDHYLDLPFDLSKVLFIATANQLDPIPSALRDRMEVIEIAGYTRLEKIHICRTHLIPRQMDTHGITDKHMELTDDALNALIENYTREAGLRNLERELASVCRKVAIQVAVDPETKIVVDPDKLEEFLGPKKILSELAERTDRPGIAIGLAWTPVGGDILMIEATRMKGQKKFTVTGKLGEVMSESAQAAMSYVRSKADDLHLPDDIFERSDIHVHVPSGAIPKDGPSAGITMATALASIMTNRRVRPDTAMTGEITLRGKVLPVGGIKEKVMAAQRAGITRIILPKANEKDLRDVPEEVRQTVTFMPVENMDEVLSLALVEELVPGTETAGSAGAGAAASA